MSNRARIEPTEFINVRTGKKSYGVRVYDDYGQSYDNSWENIPDDDMEVIKETLLSEDEVFVSIFDNVKELGKGIYVGDTWYDWTEIQHLFD
jgi:hypothetical protein